MLELTSFSRSCCCFLAGVTPLSFFALYPSTCSTGHKTQTECMQWEAEEVDCGLVEMNREVPAHPPTWSCAPGTRGQRWPGTAGGAGRLEEEICLWRSSSSHCILTGTIPSLLRVPVTHLPSHFWTDRTSRRRQVPSGPPAWSHRTPVGGHNLGWKSHTAGWYFTEVWPHNTFWIRCNKRRLAWYYNRSLVRVTSCRPISLCATKRCGNWQEHLTDGIVEPFQRCPGERHDFCYCSPSRRLQGSARTSQKQALRRGNFKQALRVCVRSLGQWTASYLWRHKHRLSVWFWKRPFQGTVAVSCQKRQTAN